MPKSPPTAGGCFEHHLVWFDGEPIVKIGCAHCGHVSKHLDLRATTSSQLVQQFIEESRAAHARLCRQRRQPPAWKRRRTP